MYPLNKASFLFAQVIIVLRSTISTGATSRFRGTSTVSPIGLAMAALGSRCNRENVTGIVTGITIIGGRGVVWQSVTTQPLVDEARDE